MAKTKRKTIKKRKVQRVLKNDFIYIRPVVALAAILLILVVLLVSRLSGGRKTSAQALHSGFTALEPTATQPHLFSLFTPLASASPTLTPMPTQTPSPQTQQPIANDFCINVPI